MHTDLQVVLQHPQIEEVVRAFRCIYGVFSLYPGTGHFVQAQRHEVEQWDAAHHQQDDGQSLHVENTENKKDPWVVPAIRTLHETNYKMGGHSSQWEIGQNFQEEIRQ